MNIGESKQLRGKRARRKRVGRGTGSRSGKTAGRGHNGARSRSGWSSRGLLGGNLPLWRRLPKRGFTNAPFRAVYSIVNVGQLERFEPHADVTPEALAAAGLVKQVACSGIKVLGDGDLTKPLNVRANAFSKGAVAKIEAAGGRADIIRRGDDVAAPEDAAVAEDAAAAEPADE